MPSSVQDSQHHYLVVKKPSSMYVTSMFYSCHGYKSTVSTPWMLADIKMFKHGKVKLKKK